MEGGAASGHAQVIAHGVVRVLAPELAWRLGVRQAEPPERTNPESHPAGFVLANLDSLAVTDAHGAVLNWLAPGEAIMMEAGASRAVVSASRRKSTFYDIALVPAAGQNASDGNGATTAAFRAPAGEAFDVDLIRDVLVRAEEQTIPASAAPMLLLVTDGAIFLQHSNGAIDKVEAGDFVQVAGDIVITGASRAPASFVVARVAAAVAPKVVLQSDEGTPTAMATPIASPMVPLQGPASVKVAAFVCPIAYTGSDFAAACREPATGLTFSIEREGEAVAARLSDATGTLRFAGVAPGEYSLLVGIPGDMAVSHTSCGTGEREGSSETAGANDISLSLPAGAAVSCRWSIVPADERFSHGSALALHIRACPAGMTPERFARAACQPAPPGSTLTLRHGERGMPVGEAQALPDGWVWKGLGAGTYGLDLDAMPEGFVGAALDGQPCCGAEHDFTVAVPMGLRRVVRTLYLFPPDVPREKALSVVIRACPPGMTDETLVDELCQPAPAGTTLTLQENGMAVGVASAAADDWTWRDLGPLTYDLRVNATPPGIIGYRLANEGPSTRDGRFAIALNDAQRDATRTLYLFQKATAGEDSDSDRDGLLDVREAEVGTQPFLPDTDGDGLSDGDEVDFYGTDALRADTDGDGLDDADELETYGTNPLLADTDGDGVLDAAEIAAGSDPLDVSNVPAMPTGTPAATTIPLAGMPRASPAARATPAATGGGRG